MGNSTIRRSAGKASPDNRLTTGRRKKKATPPRKPHPDFPLTFHPSGRWCKKIRGKLHYFGKTMGDENGQLALALWLAQKDDLLAGRTPRPPGMENGPTVGQLANNFMAFKEAAVATGELRQASWDEYHRICEDVLAQFGKNRPVADLSTSDFAGLRARFAKKAGPVRLGKLIQITRCLFKYGYDSGILAQPVRFGPGFKRPSKSTLRQHRASTPPKLFTANEITALVSHAGDSMKAMILLGLNAGMGNNDCALLEFRHLELNGPNGWGMLEFPRPKTGIERRATLWPETVRALRKVIAKRKEPANKDHSARLFITKYRGVWGSETSTDNSVTKEFVKIRKAAGIIRGGAGFYALRHTFRTVADATRDFPAIDLIMGHVDASMAGHYREQIGNDRLMAVAEYVRKWLYGDTVKQGAAIS